MVDIGKADFKILSPEQASPFMSGMVDALNMGLKFQQMGINHAKMPYVGPQQAANLQRTQLQNQWYAPEMQARIGHQNANTQHMNILNQYLPQQQQLSLLAQTLASKLAETNLGYAGQLDQARINLMNSQAKRLQNPLLGRGMGVQMNLLNGLQSQIASEHPDWDEKKVSDAASAYQMGSRTLPDGSTLPEPSGNVNTILNFIAMKSNTAQGVNQQRFAATLDTTFQNVDQLMPSVAKYAGAQGQAMLKKDQALASINPNAVTPDYANYLKFTKQAMPALASELLRTGGANSTDKQKLLALSQLDPSVLASNPQLAMQSYQYLRNLYGQIGSTIAKTPSEINASLRNGGTPTATNSASYGSPSNADYSNSVKALTPQQQDKENKIQMLMQSRQITRAQAEGMLG